ncbi:Lrp/AsnC family transcriptional regulator [Marinicaulis aureus]|uniref:Lrp/AsnC family transcriptional regulator n=1 Tax=Hyphococcus aureus TaxID=2666033 RepID=A0ABW1KZZ7_9PROT
MPTHDEKSSSIDHLDCALLNELQADGRVSVVELAERINLSKTPCQKRLRRLERDGVIRGYQADIDPAKINLGHLVFVQVKLESTRRDCLERFNAAAKKVPQILSCHMLSGGYDYLLKVRTKDMAAYRTLLGDVIADLPGVAQTSTFPVMEEVKDSSALVIVEE